MAAGRVVAEVPRGLAFDVRVEWDWGLRKGVSEVRERDRRRMWRAARMKVVM